MGPGVQGVRPPQNAVRTTTPPAGELIRFALPGQVEVQAEVGVDAQPKIIIHLDDLQEDRNVRQAGPAGGVRTR